MPADYDNPQGGTLNMTYMVLKASGDDPLPDPIVFLAGGPGQSAIVSAGDAIYGDLRQDRDLVFPAQRGTLFSHRLAIDECVAFFQPGDEHDLAAKVLELYHDPDRRALLGSQGQAFYHNHQWSVIKHDYLKVYEELVRKP